MAKSTSDEELQALEAAAYARIMKGGHALSVSALGHETLDLIELARRHYAARRVDLRTADDVAARIVVSADKLARMQSAVSRWLVQGQYTAKDPVLLDGFVHTTLELVKNGVTDHTCPELLDVILATARAIARDPLLVDSIRSAHQVFAAPSEEPTP